MSSRQSAVITKTLNFRWFEGKTITVKAGTHLQVERRIAGVRHVTDLSTLETSVIAAPPRWIGFHDGVHFELMPEEFEICAPVAV